MSKYSPTGKSLVIQIDRDNIRLALTTLGTAWPQLEYSQVIETPYGAVSDGMLMDPDAVRSAIVPLLETPELKRVHQVMFTLCTSRVLSEKVNVPKVSGAKLDALLAANLDVYFPVDVQDYVISHEQIGEAEGKLGSAEQVLQLWATPKSLLAPYYAVANSLGLSVTRIEWCGHSLMNAVGADYSEEGFQPSRKKIARKAYTAVGVDHEDPVMDGRKQPGSGVSGSETTLYLDAEPEFLVMSFVQNGHVKLQRLLNRVGNDVLADVQLVMDYFQTTDAGQYSTIQGRLTGSIPDLYDQAERLSEELDIPVRVLSAEWGPEWYLCAGAALAPVDFGSVANNRISQPKDQVQQLWQYGLVFAGGLALIGVMLFTLISRVEWSSQEGAIQSTNNALTMQVAQESARYADVRDSFAQYQEDYAAYSDAYDRFAADQQGILDSVRTYNGNLVLMLLELESVLPEGTMVHTIGIGDEGLGLEFACADKTEAAQLIQDLRSLEYATLEDISPLSLQRSSAASGYAMLSSLDEILAQEAAQREAMLQMMMEADQAEAAEEPAEETSEETLGLDELPPLDGSADGEEETPEGEETEPTPSPTPTATPSPTPIPTPTPTPESTPVPVITPTPYEWEEYPIEKRSEVLTHILVEDDDGWDLFLETMAQQNPSAFSDIFTKARSKVLTDPNFHLSSDEWDELFDLMDSSDAIKEAMEQHDPDKLDALLGDHRVFFARLLTADQEMLEDIEGVIGTDQALTSYYVADLKRTDDPDATPTPASEATPTPVPTPTNTGSNGSGIDKKQLLDLLIRMGLLDKLTDSDSPLQNLSDSDKKLLFDFLNSLTNGGDSTQTQPTSTTSNGNGGSSMDEKQLREMLTKLGLLDQDGNPTTGTGSGRGLGTADGTVPVSSDTVYFAVVLRYRDELIQKELESKETPIELPEKLTPIGYDEEG